MTIFSSLRPLAAILALAVAPLAPAQAVSEAGDASGARPQPAATADLARSYERLRFGAPETLDNTIVGGVNAITQDRLGFIWFGTAQGLFRYDGLRLKPFTHKKDDPRSLAYDTVWTFHIDARDQLWIGTQKGVSRFDAETETFENFLSGENWPNANLSNRINGIESDSKGRVLISTEAGYIYRFDDSKMRFVQLNAAPLGIIKSMDCDPFDRLWIGIDNGIVRYQPDTHQTKAFLDLFNNEERITPNFINGLLYLDDERIWIGTSSSGVAILDSLASEVTFLPLAETGDRYVPQIARGDNGTIWAVSNGGISVYREDGERISRIAYNADKGRVPLAGINTVFNDRQGNVWIGSHFDGISVSTQGKNFQKLPLHKLDPGRDPTAPVAAVLKDSRGNIWVAHSKSGVDIFPPDGGAVLKLRHKEDDPSSLSALPVLKIFEDSRGEIWIGTFRGGLYRYLPESRSFKAYLHDETDRNSIGGQDIRDIAEDERGNLWINTHGAGIDYFDRETEHFTHFRNSTSDANYSIIDDWAWAIHYDDQGHLWIGTNLGVSILNPRDRSVRNFQADISNPHGLSNSVIKDIYQDSKGRVWLASEDGLNLYDPEIDGFHSFSVESGFPHRTIMSIVEDAFGKLWVGTYDGLARFDPETSEVKTYLAGDGISSNKFFEGAAFRDQTGAIYFGQYTGVTFFDPAEIVDNAAPPPVFITDLQIANESLEVEPEASSPGALGRSVIGLERIQLRPDQKIITFEFSALNFIHPSENQYSYKLEGFDDEWSVPSARRTVTYTNLNPGQYTFRVRASNNDGYWNLEGDRLHLEVLPPFWGTIWFRLLAVTLVMSLPIGFAVWRVSSIKASKRALEVAVDERTRDLKRAHRELELAYNQIFAHGETLEETVKRRTEELEVAKAKAERSDRLKSAFLANISHEIRTPMNAILGFLHFLDRDDLAEDERQRYSNVIRQSGQSLITLIDNIIDLSSLEAGAAEISPSPANLHEIYNELRNHFSDAIKRETAKDITLQIETAPAADGSQASAHFVDIDPLRLKQILWNLVSNAIKFTESGEIRVGYRVVPATVPKRSPRIEFYVMDTGIGIPEDQWSEIFDRFHKLERQGQKFYRGAGLGLTITKKLTELMQGEISVSSRPGEGTTFTVSLPYNPVDPAAKSPRDALPTPAFLSDTPDFSGFSLLVVEDEQPTCEYIANVLKDTRIGIAWAESAKEAERRFRAGEFHLVLLDLKLPDADGLDLARMFRHAKPSVPIIALSTFSNPSDTIDVLHAGASAHLTKPVRPEALIETLRRQLDALEPAR